MRMSPRQAVTDIFSTFLQFEAEGLQGWVADSKLRRSMQKQLLGPLEHPLEHPLESQAQAARWEGDTWALYWHRYWQAGGAEQRRCQAHLAAYLQEACYWAAGQALPRVVSLRYSLADCFQLAIAEVPKILQAFVPHQAASLKTYGRVAFGNIIRDALRREREIDICSDWSLLLKVSRKRLQAALQNGGLAADVIAQYLGAWQCFETAYLQSPPTAMRQRRAPDRVLWQAVATLYNQNPSFPNQPPETLEKWLTTSAQRVRADLYPSVTSLNTPRASEGPGELQDDLPADQSASLLEGLIGQEEQADRQAQQQQVHHRLATALEQLDAMAVQLMDLYYGQHRTQQQIAQQLDLQQYTVSRRLAKARTALLLALAQWSQDTLHIAPSSTVMTSISAILEEWLEDFYSPHNQPKTD
jgi:RNA polymerase sigma factor (sigma-70 family)